MKKIDLTPFYHHFTPNRQQYGSFSLIPFSRDRKYYWKEVELFPKGKKQYLPIDCIYYPVSRNKSYHPYTFSNSSGVAAGFSFEEALLRGIYELIERDAFMMVWLKRMVMPTIKLISLPKEVQERVNAIKNLGYDIYFVDITLDITPVILVVAVGCDCKPALTLGSASNLNKITACSKALSEVEQQLYWELRTSVESKPLLNPREVRTVYDHAALYYHSRHVSKVSFLWKGKEIPISMSKSPECELESIVEVLENQNRKIITVNLAPISMKKAGIHIVRAIIPGLVPISFGYNMEPLGMNRLREFPPKSKKVLWKRDEIFVHPFS